MMKARPSVEGGCHFARVQQMREMHGAEGTGEQVTREGRDGLCHGKQSVSPLRSYVRFDLAPFLQRGNVAKCPRIHLAGNAHPVDRCALCQAIDTHPLMRIPHRAGRHFPEPQYRRYLRLIYFDETALLSHGLKSLDMFHARSSYRTSPLLLFPIALEVPSRRKVHANGLLSQFETAPRGSVLPHQ